MTQNLREPVAHPTTEASVRSADGTPIGFYRLGKGPSVVFVHGSIAKHTDWMPVARLLANSFTCFVMDRRGRGKSGRGTSAYSIERECEDIAAVATAAGPDTSLVGHSYGAICTLEAALRFPVRRLVAYEPPLPIGGPVAGEFLGPYAAAVQRGDYDAAMSIGLAHFNRLPEPAIAKMRTSRGWPRMCAMAPTWARELEAMDNCSQQAERYKDLSCPVMLLAGTESPEHPMKDAARALATLPGVCLEVLNGYDHVGMRTAPALVAQKISQFLLA